MHTDNLITPDGLAASLKMAAEAMKKNPNVIKSTAGYMKLRRCINTSFLAVNLTLLLTNSYLPFDLGLMVTARAR